MTDQHRDSPGPIQIGTARSRPGQLAYGVFDAVKLPTGEMDAFPVIIAQGTQPGPVLWLTANIHGSEYGLAAITACSNPNSSAACGNRRRDRRSALPGCAPASGARTICAAKI